MFYKRKRYVYRQEESGDGEAGGAAPAGESEAGASQAEGQTEEKLQTVAPEIEEKARKMGWTPKNEFKGDPAKWRDAAEFVERGENMLPILRKTVEKQQAELADLKKSIKEFAEYHSKTEQRAYAKAYGELKAQQMQAVAEGNTEAFKQIDEKIEDLQKEVSSKKPISVPKDDDPADDPEYMDWASRNKWMEDKTLEKEAVAQAAYLRERGDKRVGEEFLNAVKERVKKEFPEKFSNPRRNSAPSVEGGTPVAKKSGKTFADMPKEDRETCERMEKRYGIKREEYVRTYFEGGN